MNAKRIIHIVLGALLMSVAARAADSPAAPACAIIPTPATVHPTGGRMALSAPARLVLCPGCDSLDRSAAHELNLWLGELGLDSLLVQDFAPGASIAGAVLVGPAVPGSPVTATLQAQGLKPASLPPGEGYVLAAGRGAVVAAAGSSAGRFYALMSLAQCLSRTESGLSLPEGVILDHPALGLRGISDDISRGQVSTPDDFESLVRFLARYKMNVYMPYLEDMFLLDSRPGFGAGRGALSASEVRRLAAFAARLHVRLIPAFQTLGHYENFLLQPENFPLAEFPGAQCLSPAVDSVYGFLRGALAEVAAAFPDSLINVGCDESWDVGRGKSRTLVRSEGLAAVHAGHYRKVYDIVRGLDRRMLMYGDIILSNPEILDRIPRDILVVDWHYNAAPDYPSVTKFRKAGFNVVVSPGFSNWSRFYPNSATALDNIENLTRAGFAQGALGVVTSGWGDFGGPNLRQTIRYGAAFAAACAWNPEHLDRSSFQRTFWRQFFATDNPEPFIRLDSLLAAIGRSAFDDWWRHPALGPSPRGMIGVVKDGSVWGARIEANMDQAREALQAAGPAVRANRWYLDYCSLAADMGSLLGAKFRWMDRCAKAGNTALSPRTADALSDSARALRGRLADLRPRYVGLWLQRNRPEGLDNILSLWDRQLLYWDSLIDSLSASRQVGHAELEGWIAPRASLAVKPKAGERNSYFTAELKIPAGLDSVKMQLMGESDVQAWVGGLPVGRKVARLSLSEIVDRRRAVVVELGGLLKAGANRLAFSVTNYEGKTPSLNIYGEMYAGGGVAGTFGSSTAWRGAELGSPPAGWNAPAFDSSAWARCGVYAPDKPVSRPFLARGLPSRVER